MKTIIFANIRKSTVLLVLSVIVILASCSKIDQGYEGKNIITLTPGAQSINDGDKSATITVKVELTLPEKNDISFNFAFENAEINKVLSISNPVLIKAGQTVGEFTVKSNGIKVLKPGQENLKTHWKILTEGWEINANNSSYISIKNPLSVPPLSEKVKALLKKYKDKGMDITPFMGIVVGKLKIHFNDGNNNVKKTYLGKYDYLEDIETGIVLDTIRSTDDVPVLKMVTNAMGMNDFLLSYLKDIFASDGIGGKDAMYEKFMTHFKVFESEETMNVSLENIRIQKDGTIKFLDTKRNYYEDVSKNKEFLENSTFNPINNVVNFLYDFSAQKRWLAAPDDDVIKYEFYGDKYETKVKEERGRFSFNPGFYLFETPLTKDGAKDSGGNYVTTFKAPLAKIDFNAKTMSFSFPMDHIDQGQFSLVTVEYIAKK